MTLQASSSRLTKAGHFSPRAHAFWQAAREGWAVPALSLLVYLAMFMGTFIKMAFDARQNDAALADLGKYYLFSPLLSYVLPAIFLIAAVVQSAVMFRFLFHRSSSNAWLSLGLNRSELFLSRFLAGLAGVWLPIVASMVVMLGINLASYPDTSLVLIRWFQMTAGLAAQAGVFYAIACAVCVSVGTMAEGLIYSVIAACLPLALLVGVNALMVGFLFGCGTGAPEEIWSGFNPQLAADLSAYNPLLFLYEYIGRYAADDGRTLTQVSALPTIGWLVAGGAFTLLARRLFRSRRAETTGAMGGNRWLGFAAIFAVGFLAFAVPYMFPCDLAGRLPAGVWLMISILIFVVVFCVLAFPLRLVRRPVWKGLLALPAELAVVFAVVGVLASGGFGYSGYVPDADDVASASVSYSGIPTYVAKGGWSSGGGLIWTVQFETMIHLDDPQDIVNATSLHRAFVDVGKPAYRSGVTDPNEQVYGVRYRMNYVLKDGRTVSRLYSPVSRDLILKMTAIDGFSGAKAAFRSHITNEGNNPEDWSTFLTDDVYLSSRFLDRTVLLPLDEAQKKELLVCIAGDVTTQSVEDRYFPAKPEVCIIDFASEGTSLSGGLPDWSERVVVTESFAKTVQFLNRTGMLDEISAPADVDYLEVMNILKDSNYRFDIKTNAIMPLLMNRKYSTISEKGFFKITDAAQISSVLQGSRAQYLMADGGYVVCIHYKGADFITTAFLPMKNAPDYVKAGAK